MTTIMTIDGPGTLLEKESVFGQTNYRVAGNGFSGWYSSREILADSDDDEDHTSTMAFEEDPLAPQGTELPWNPEPTAEWEGEETQQPDGAEIDLTPTKSTEDLVREDPLDHNQVFGSAPRTAMRQYIALLESDEFIREAAWVDVRKKGKKLFDGGSVTVESNSPREIVALVDGDHGRYETQVHRKNAFGQGVTWWNCECEWGKTAYTRVRTFVGRMCSHALATYYAMQAGVVPSRKDVTRLDERTERHALGKTAAAKANDGLNDDERAVLSYVRTESITARQGGLMVWDDDLSKVVKQLYQGAPPPALGADPGMPPAAGGDPSLGQDPNAVPGGVDPTTDPGADPSAGFGDPTQGDPNGAGMLPAGSTPPYVRSESSPTVPDPTKALTASHSNFPAPRVPRTHFSEFTNGDPANNFEEWDEAEPTSTETFNDVDELEEDNDPEAAFYDGEESPIGRTSTYHPEELGLIENDSVDMHLNPYDEAAAEAWKIQHPGQKLPKALKKGSQEADSEHSWQEDQDPEDTEEYHDDDLNYHDDEHEEEGKTAFRSIHERMQPTARVANNGPDLTDFFEDDGSAFSSYKEAAAADRFNDEEAEDLVAAFQRSAGAAGLGRTAGRNFSYAEQEELINEPGMASQIGNLNLTNSFYE